MLEKREKHIAEMGSTDPNEVSFASCGLTFEQIKTLIHQIPSDGTLNYKFKVIEYQTESFPASFKALFYQTQEEFVVKFSGIHDSFYYIETLNLKRKTKAHIWRMMTYLRSKLK